MKELRLALIGCGSHSRIAHASALSYFTTQNPGSIQLAAVCDIAIERARSVCQEYGFARAYSNWQEMLEVEQPDGVISVLPIENITEVAGELFRRNIPCVIEKPPGRTLEEASALAELARQTGAPHMVSMNRRFSPYLNRAMEWATQIGPLRYVRGQMFRNARREDDFLWGTGVHIVDAMCYIGGEIESSAIQRLENSASDTPWFLISLCFTSGCIGTIEILPTAGYDDEIVELFGDDYRAVVHTMGQMGETVHCWKSGVLEWEMTANPEDPLFLRNGSYEETSAFIKALREGADFNPTLQDVLPTLKVCGQAARCRTGTSS